MAQTNLLLLFDYNNMAHRCVHLKGMSRGNEDEYWKFLAYMIFHNMYIFAMDIADALDAGDTVDVVLALDSIDGYWRRDLYPPYKADRGARRVADGVDWRRAYMEFGLLADTIRACTPWRVLRVHNCEADDIIYALATGHSDGPVVIHSGDSDYMQLVDENISVYSPNLQEYVEFPRDCKIGGGSVLCHTPEEYLQYAILTGQGGKDNVYNVKTPADWAGQRKPGFGVKAAQKFVEQDNMLEALDQAGLLENYRRNEKLIAMRELPEEYHQAIMQAYAKYTPASVDMYGILDCYGWNSLCMNRDIVAASLDMLTTGIVKNEVDLNGHRLQ